MPLDTDISNADSQMHVEFYVHERDPYVGVPFVRIMNPGDKTNIFDQPVRDHHKERFPRQWLHFQMQGTSADAIGTPLAEWHKLAPEEFSDFQMAELHILKFQTVEQVATASDAQLQRVGMGATGLRNVAREFLNRKNSGAHQSELAETKKALADLQAQVAGILEHRGPGRPRKEA